MQTALWNKPAQLLPITREQCSFLTQAHSQRPPRRSTAAVGKSARAAQRSRLDATARSPLSRKRCRHPASCSNQPRSANRVQTAAAAATSTNASTDTGLPDLPLPEIPVKGKGLGSLALRVIFGSVLGAVGAIVITAGGWLFTTAVCLVAYQATQEFFGFMNSKSASEGHTPPSRIVSVLTTVLCLGLSIWSHITNGKATAALAVASFAVLAVHVSLTEKPTTAQLASAVFGLFYCGTFRTGGCAPEGSVYVASAPHMPRIRLLLASHIDRLASTHCIVMFLPKFVTSMLCAAYFVPMQACESIYISIHACCACSALLPVTVNHTTVKGDHQR